MAKEQSNLRERALTKLHEPSKYQVIMHNDDFTTMEFVVKVLKLVFRKEEAEANSLMLTVHKRGQATVGIYTFDMATSKCQKAMEMARNEGFPFKLTVEPEMPF